MEYISFVYSCSLYTQAHSHIRKHAHTHTDKDLESSICLQVSTTLAATQYRPLVAAAANNNNNFLQKQHTKSYIRNRTEQNINERKKQRTYTHRIGIELK